jgi:nicotinate-nucleotide adenylyltransferase
MALLCFGGTFNPIHHGHLICARAVAEIALFDKILLIPTLIPPHKLSVANIAEPQHRLEMCRLAVNGDPLFEVSALELRRSGPSYTFDTVQELARQGHGKVHWLIGADMVPILPQWHRALELIEQLDFVIMTRPGWRFNWQSLPREFQRLQHNVVPTPLIDISSTDIRRRVQQGQSIDYLTPQEVQDYIQAHRLYAAAAT